MKELAQLLNAMQPAGVIRHYALFGAMAQMRYTEPVATLDADVLVAVDSSMTELQALLERQAACQKNRKTLTWPEKIRMVEQIRESVAQLRAQPRPKAPGPPKP